MRGFLSALAFLTVAPVPKSVNADVAGLRASLGWYPAVGILLGLANLGVFLVLQATPVVAGLAATATAFILTRALHLDGLADSMDALFAGGTPARKREILKDPRHGTFGVLAIVMDALARVIILASTGLSAPVAVFAAPVAGRWAMVFALSRSGYDPAGKLKDAASGSGRQSLGWATITVVALMTPLYLFGGVGTGAAFMLPVALLLLLTRFYIGFVRKKLGVMPGDALGALNEVTELAVLASFYAFGRQ
jgi:adenosylcobinamide-GDP ribazoletransferase